MMAIGGVVWRAAICHRQVCSSSHGNGHECHMVLCAVSSWLRWENVVEVPVTPVIPESRSTSPKTPGIPWFPTKTTFRCQTSEWTDSYVRSFELRYFFRCVNMICRNPLGKY
jgi:hypothetical protein